MTILTLIPDAHTYGITLLIVWIIGYVAVTNFFYARYFSFRKTNIVFVGAVVRSMVVIYGLLLIPINSLFSTNWILTVLSLPVAILLAWVTLHIDKTIIRYFLRHPLYRQLKTTSTSDQTDFFSMNITNLGLSTRNSSEKRIGKMHGSLNRFSKEPQKNNYGLIAICITAITEEILFRGFLVFLCLLIPNGIIKYILLGSTVLLFALSHIALGWEQVMAKSVLALVTLALRLIFQSVIPGIIVHVILNSIAYKEARNARQVEVTNLSKYKQLWN